MRCGALMSDADMTNHICDENDVPEKGKPIKKGFKKGEIAV